MNDTTTARTDYRPDPLDGVEKVFHVDEVAQHLGTTPQTVYRLIRAGRIRAVKVGRLVRVPQSGLEEYLHGDEAA